MRVLLDEMYPRRLAEELRSGGHDVVAVVESHELRGLPDEDVARVAAAQARVVVTENVADFVLLDADLHAGLLLVNARRWPRTPNGLPVLRRALAAWLDERAGVEAVRGSGVVAWL